MFSADRDPGLSFYQGAWITTGYKALAGGLDLGVTSGMDHTLALPDWLGGANG